MFTLQRRFATFGSLLLFGTGLILALARIPRLGRELSMLLRKRRTAKGTGRSAKPEGELENNADEEDQFGILLFYEYAFLSDVTTVIRELETICRDLGLCGRLRVSEEGFNGNLSGPWVVCKEFIAAVQQRFKELRGTDFKLAPCSMQHLFRNLKVWESDEVCGLFAAQEGLDRAAAAQSLAEADRGQHLSPEKWHEMMSNADANDVVMFDVRNRYETRIGCFARNTGSNEESPKLEPLQLVDPNTRFFHEIPDYLAQEENLNRFRGKKVMMYCTGGVRCERASALLKRQLGGAAEIYQLAGGIQRYLEAHPDGGHFRGSMHVFDRRGRVSAPDCAAPGAVNEKHSSSVIGHCIICACPWDRYQGKWRCQECGLLILICTSCQGRFSKGSKRNDLRCELCDRTACASEAVPSESMEEQKLPKGSAPPPRLLTFADRAERLSRHYESAAAREDVREMLKWLNSRRLRERISSSKQALKALRGLFDEAQRHEDVNVVLACSQAVEHLLRDLPARAAICRAMEPVHMVSALLKRHTLEGEAGAGTAQVALQILWRVAEVSEARAALVEQAEHLSSALLEVCRTYSKHLSVQRDACLVVRAFAEQPELRRIVQDPELCVLVINAAEFATSDALIDSASGHLAKGVPESAVEKARAEVAGVACAAFQALQGCSSRKSIELQARAFAAAKVALKKYGTSSHTVKKWAPAIISSNAHHHTHAEDVAKPVQKLPASPLPPLQLKDVVDVATLKNETATNARSLWLERFRPEKRVLAGVLAGPEYKALRNATATCPTFLAPVLRGPGVVNLVWQAQGDRFLYQSLEAFHGGAAGAGAGRADLVVTLFPEFLQSHGLVFLHAQLCSDFLSKHEAAGIVRFTRQAYAEPVWFERVKIFNLESNKFDFNKFLAQFVESNRS